MQNSKTLNCHPLLYKFLCLHQWRQIVSKWRHTCNYTEVVRFETEKCLCNCCHLLVIWQWFVLCGGKNSLKRESFLANRLSTINSYTCLWTAYVWLDSSFSDLYCVMLRVCFNLQQDQFDRLLPTFIQVIELTEQEETRYWDVISAVFEGKQVDSVISNSSCYENPGRDSIGPNFMDAGINNKVF